MRSYQLTRAAADDVADIFLASLTLFGLAQADKYHTGIEATFEFLAAYPLAARLRQEIDPPVRAYPYKAHLIVYDVAADATVVILRVRHAHEDWLSGSD